MTKRGKRETMGDKEPRNPGNSPQNVGNPWMDFETPTVNCLGNYEWILVLRGLREQMQYSAARGLKETLFTEAAQFQSKSRCGKGSYSQS